ncbi:MAG: ABC transporter permease subunit [Bacillota bacterium]
MPRTALQSDVTIQRYHTIKVISSRGLISTLFGPGFYIVMCLSLLAPSILIYSYLGSVRETGLASMSNLIGTPFSVWVSIWGLFLSISSSLAVSREKELGTIEELFYGPVGPTDYVLARYVEHLLVYLVALAVSVCYFSMVSLLTNFSMSGTFIPTLLLSIFSVSTMVAFGILVSVVASKTRSSLTLLLTVALIFLGLDLAQGFLLGHSLGDPVGALPFGMSVLGWIARLTRWVSPFSNLGMGMDAAARGDIRAYGIVLVHSAAYSCAMLWMAVNRLKRKGVRA